MSRAALVTMAFSSFAAYVWATRRFFILEGVFDPRMVRLAISGLAAMAVQLVLLGTEPLEPATTTVGIVVYALGAAVFAAACRAAGRRALPIAFSSTNPAALVTNGPFRYVRHPFYLAYSLTWIAGVIGARSIAASVVTALMLAQYVLAARLEERRLVSSPLGAAYREYRRRTGMFVPMPPATAPNRSEQPRVEANLP